MSASNPAVTAPGREEFLRSLRENVLRYAAARIGPDKAEEVAQETLMLLITKYAGVTGQDELVPLSIGIAKNMLRKIRRFGSRENASIDVNQDWRDERSDTERDLLRLEDARMLSRALQKMGEKCRELFRLRLQRKTTQQIMKIMGARTENALYTWNSRCKENLMRILRTAGPKEPVSK